MILACSKKETPPGGTTPRQILADLGPATDYYELAEGHSEKGEVILLASPGGPAPDLHQGFPDMHNFFAVAYVHQAQTLRNQSDGLDHRLVSGNEIISIDKAKKASMKSAAILHKVAAHFKDQGKTVYLITHSFGSFIIPHTLTHYGNNFDKIFIGAGRLDIQEEVYKAFLDRCGGTFNSDGQTFQEITCEDLKKYNPEVNNTQAFQAFRSTTRLQGALGENRYTQLLANVPLNNVIYVYGNSDEAVGRLSSKEITFLKEKKAQVIALDTGHDLQELTPPKNIPNAKTILAEDFNNQVLNFFISPLPSSYSLLTIPDEGKMAAYNLGQSGGSGDKYRIGILFENHSARQISYKLNSVFGDGPFSLFKTNIFKDHKSKFHIEFGNITQNEDQNVFNIAEDQKKELSKRFIQAMQNAQSREDMDNAFIDFKKEYPDLNLPTYYFDFFLLRELREKTDLTEQEQNQKRDLEQSRNRFTNFFQNVYNQNKNFDLVIYVSSGIPGGYANTQANINIHPTSQVIYMPSNEFISVFVPTMGMHSDSFAITLVHELGHIFGNLVDEYYAYRVETDQTPVKNDLALNRTFNFFRNNCFRWYQTSEFSSSTLRSSQAKIPRIIQSARNNFDDINIYYPIGTTGVAAEQILDFVFDLSDVLNPWTHQTKVPFLNKRDSVDEEAGHITGYDGSLYGGCDGGKSFRGTENSIMHSYHLYHAKDWPDAWGPINSYYLKKEMNLQ